MLSFAEATAGAAAIVATVIYVQDVLGYGATSFALVMATLGLGSTLTALTLGVLTLGAQPSLLASTLPIPVLVP